MDLGPPPPIMKTFKEFLLSVDDSVDETEAVKRYNEYKLDFRRQQMQDFFLAHKDEEWYDLNCLYVFRSNRSTIKCIHNYSYCCCGFCMALSFIN